MYRKHSCTGLLAAAVIAATTTLVFAQANSSQGMTRGQEAQDKATTAEGNEAWTKPEINSPPPTPNGGMSSGTHVGNESPTMPGISGGDRDMSKESKKNLDRATSGNH
jgi:hypothetical protein